MLIHVYMYNVHVLVLQGLGKFFGICEKTLQSSLAVFPVGMV